MKEADIFISYRLDDEPAVAGRLLDCLRNAFPQHAIFMNPYDRTLHDDLVCHPIQLIAKCSVFLPIIGPRWLCAEPPSALPKLFDEQDPLRKEIESALTSKCLIIPVLADNCRMPTPSVIPPSISKLARLNATLLSHAHFRDDAKPLIAAMKLVVKHPFHSHLSIAQVEAYELGSTFGGDLLERVSKAVQVTGEAMGASMMEKFVPVAQLTIAQRDAETLHINIAAFRDEVDDVKAELTKGTMQYLSEDRHPIINPYKPNDELYLKIQEQVQNGFENWSVAMLDRVTNFVVKEMEHAGWRPEMLKKG